jgi:fructose-bisphosphate aldolase, class II
MLPLINLLSDYFSAPKAIAAFNIDSFEIFQAVEQAVSETSLPCIVQLSAGEDDFVTAEKLYLLVKKANLDGLPLYLNMDHGHDPARLQQTSRLGFDMVHFDGSSLPYAENLASSIKLVLSIHPRSLVEVEFDEIGSVDFTQPPRALEFMTETKADLLAVSIGNRHGSNPALPESIDLVLLKKIHETLPSTFLTLHGGSGIPQNLIREALKLGIVKININTDLRLAFLNAIKRELSTNTSEKIYQVLTPAIAAVKEIVKEKMLLFSS